MEVINFSQERRTKAHSFSIWLIQSYDSLLHGLVLAEFFSLYFCLGLELRIISEQYTRHYTERGITVVTNCQ